MIPGKEPRSGNTGNNANEIACLLLGDCRLLTPILEFFFEMYARCPRYSATALFSGGAKHSSEQYRATQEQ